MAVAQILARKGRSVVTVAPGRTLQEIAGILADKKIGAVVVVDAKGAIAGIVSERDVVSAVARHGAAGGHCRCPGLGTGLRRSHQ